MTFARAVAASSSTRLARARPHTGFTPSVSLFVAPISIRWFVGSLLRCFVLTSPQTSPGGLRYAHPVHRAQGHTLTAVGDAPCPPQTRLSLAPLTASDAPLWAPPMISTW